MFLCSVQKHSVLFSHTSWLCSFPPHFSRTSLSLSQLCLCCLTCFDSSPRSSFSSEWGLFWKRILFFFFFFFFSGSHLQHIEVPRLGVKLELQLLGYATATATWDPSHICDLCCSLQQRRILNWARPVIKPASPWILVGFFSHWATRRTPGREFL